MTTFLFALLPQSHSVSNLGLPFTDEIHYISVFILALFSEFPANAYVRLLPSLLSRFLAYSNTLLSSLLFSARCAFEQMGARSCKRIGTSESMAHHLRDHVHLTVHQLLLQMRPGRFSSNFRRTVFSRTASLLESGL